ncbi:hypothetical protein XENTR_v10007847 [Xenopus tropicalis]|nr:hypothetical protein XENTR_v10007847 [Xenopus tropicalis]
MMPMKQVVPQPNGVSPGCPVGGNSATDMIATRENTKAVIYFASTTSKSGGRCVGENSLWFFCIFFSINSQPLLEKAIIIMVTLLATPSVVLRSKEPQWYQFSALFDRGLKLSSSKFHVSALPVVFQRHISEY